MRFGLQGKRVLLGMETMLGEVQLDWSVVGLVRPRLRHCIRRTPPRPRPTDDWRVSSPGTVQGLQSMKRRD